MIKSPKSLTATIHVRFNYDGSESKVISGEGPTEIIGRILDQAADMEPEMQELLVRFADYLNGKRDDKAKSPE